MDKLKINIKGVHKVPDFVVAESELNVESERKEMVEILFEQSKTRRVYIDKESSFSLIWHDTPTGVIVDCGDLITSIVPFHNGERLPNDVVLNYGGRDVTMSLVSNLQDTGHYFLNPTYLSHISEIRKIKEKYGRVDANDERSLRRRPEVIDVSTEVFGDHVSYLLAFLGFDKVNEFLFDYQTLSR